MSPNPNRPRIPLTPPGGGPTPRVVPPAAPSPVPLPEVPLAALALGAELGSGNQAPVYELAGDPTRVAKIYPPGTPVREAAFAEIHGARLALDPAGRARVDGRVAWPEVLVRGPDGSCRGFVMARVDDRFLLPSRSGTVLCKLQHALHPERARRIGLAVPDAAASTALSLTFAETLAALHSVGIALGDISQRNLLWVRDRHGVVHVFLLDLDSAALSGRPPALPPVQTPGWVDPTGPGPTLATDRHKLGLLVFRTAHAVAQAVPAPADPRLDAAGPGWSPELGDLTRRALHAPPGRRPPAADWVTALAALAAATHGRTVPPPRPTPPVGTSAGARPAVPTVATSPARRPALPVPTLASARPPLTLQPTAAPPAPRRPWRTALRRAARRHDAAVRAGSAAAVLLLAATVVTLVR